MPTFENELNQLLPKNPEHINSPNMFIIHPFFQEHTHIPALANLFPQMQEIEGE